MTAIVQALQVHQFGHDLQQYNLDFEKVVIHSRLHEFEKRVEDSGLSIKLPIKGQENYLIGNECYTVGPGNYLIVNKHQQFNCYLKSEEAVEAFCIYLKSDIVREVYANKLATLETCLEAPHLTHYQHLNFHERIYNLQENCLGDFLQNFIRIYKEKGDFEMLNSEGFYYQLAEKLLDSHFEIEDQIRQLPSAKLSTRKELYARLSHVRNYIFDNYYKPIQLEDLSKVALISKFHLLRTYRQVFGITPYQQILSLRLEKAKQLMRKESSVEEIAYQLGFSDRRSFTKAFKKRFQKSPSDYKKASYTI